MSCESQGGRRLPTALSSHVHHSVGTADPVGRGLTVGTVLAVPPIVVGQAVQSESNAGTLSVQSLSRRTGSGLYAQVALE